MGSFIGKLNLYDFLACLIPGFLLLVMFTITIEPDLLHKSLDLKDYAIIFTASYIIGLLWKTFMENLWTEKKLRNNPKNILIALNEAEIDDYAKNKINIRISELKSINNDKAIRCIYYEFYYQAVSKYKNTSIPSLESQLAFLRSMILIIVLYSIPSCRLIFKDGWSNENFTTAFFVTAFLGVLSYLIFRLCLNIQHKIYKLVWEDSYYVSKL